MSARENLESARALIANENDWCINELRQTRPDGGTQYCALGALMAVGINPAAFGALEGAMGGSIARYNNTRGHACVLAAFDAAIEKVGAEPC